MSIRIYRYGNSNEVYARVGPVQEDREPARLRTPLHVAGTTLQSFRVVARLRDGNVIVVCLGATRAEALAAVRAQAAELPPEVKRLWLERWAGNLVAGRWVGAPCARNELPLVRSRPGLRRRGRSQR
jgi:hypothetical protein